MLSQSDRRILDFERGWFLFPQPKDRTIHELLGVTPQDYYTRLRELLLLPEAAEYDPLTVLRLRRMVGAA
jgi:hypothetical protein